MIGEILDGKYRIDNQLGAGGMGNVYLATHLGTTRVVAVKVIAPKWAADPHFLGRFQREAQACGLLRHPNIVKIFAVGKDGDVVDRLWHLAGPVLTASLAGIALYPRYLRTEVLEVIRQDYVRTAQAKGLAERTVRWIHVLRNCLIPMVTLLGGILTIVLAGSFVIEQVFNWPGIGRLFFEAITNKDYPVIQADVLAGSMLLLLSFIIRDIAYAWVDPRVKVSA